MATIRWTNPDGGLWATAADWTGGKVPGAADDAIVAGSGTGTISFFRQAAVRTLLLDAPNGTIAAHATFRLGQEMVIQAGLFRLYAGGTIEGGLIADEAFGLRSQGGTLSGVNYQGTLVLSQKAASLTIERGIGLAGAGGVGRATILLTGAGSELAVVGTTTLDNAVLDIGVGPPGATPTGLCQSDPGRHGATLTLGTQFAVVETGAFAGLHAGAAPTDEIVNQGSIKAAYDGGSFAIDGASFSNAGTITVSNGDTLSIGSTICINTGHLGATPGGAGQGATRLSFQGPISNTGTIQAAAGLTSFSEDVTGAGRLQIGAAGTLALLAGAVAGQTVDFLAAGGQLAITNPSVFDAAITHWGAGDRIDLVNVVSNSDTFANGTLSVLEAGQVVAALRFEGAYTQGEFMVTTDDVGGTAITFV